jgi:phage major head subunit gpT-like protein
LGAVANKQILAGYMEGDQTWREVAEIKPVSNFYTQNHYRMLDSLEYEEVGSGGEIKHGTLGEETYTSQAKTYGKMLGLTRTQIINDDLGAFNDIRTRLGRGASKKFSNVFWAEFMDNSSFYTTALTNYIEGSTTNLGTDGVGLGLMVKAFRNMTSPAADGSKRVGQDINPTKILVPTELESNALLAYVNANLGAVANSSANIYQNRFRPVVQWRLSNSSYTGYSTTAFYMFGDEVKPMLVTFLNGNQSPIIESTDADFNTLGIQFRGYHDFGCDKSEYLAGVKSKGAS